VRPAFSITQDSILTIWNIVLGVVVMLWAFGYRTVKELLSKNPTMSQEMPRTVAGARPGHEAPRRRMRPIQTARWNPRRGVRRSTGSA
jgi:hypothetical protein